MKSKRFIITCFSLFLTLSVLAISKDSLHAVTMVSYEQRSTDDEGTLALRNNTGEDIKDVSFRIEYLDMAGKPLDYKDFTKKISIAPGMTKKVNIPAYEQRRNYHYYKSKDELSKAIGSPAFKIVFKVKGYNAPVIKSPAGKSTAEEDRNSITLSDTESGIMGTTVVVIGIIFIVGIYFGWYVLVAVMAKYRNRNPALWVLLSLIGTPLLMMIILLCIGKDESASARYDSPSDLR
ncbi:MAG: hypothetical protein ACFNTB_07685 [Prevotella denticola]